MEAQVRREVREVLRVCGVLWAVWVAAPGALAGQERETSDEARACHELRARSVAEGVLELDFESFDQDPDGGWRVLADAGCLLGAAALVDAYAERKPAHPMRWLLRFHAGQLYALGGDEETAIARFEEGRQEGATQWNLYVEATLAFLRGEEEELARIRDELAALGTPEGPAMNLGVVDRLLEQVGRSYADAYAGGRRGG